MTQRKKAKSKVSSKKALTTTQRVVALSQRSYPVEGTVFVLDQVPYIVESSENLSVLSDTSKDVACHSLSSGFTDVKDWFSLVEEGSVEVIWCPKRGRVLSNKDYMGL